MKLHANAALSLNKRRQLCSRVCGEDWSLAEAPEAAEVSEPTARKWVARYRAEGEAGLLDRPSTANRVHNRTPEDRIEAICALRHPLYRRRDRRAARDARDHRLGDPHQGRARPARAARLGTAPPLRAGASRRAHPHRRQEAGRIQGGAGKRVRGGTHSHYSRTFTDRAGKRRNTVGWEFVHIAIDDATRLAYAEVLGDEKAKTAVGFLRRTLAFFASHGVAVERVMTDNGSAYRSAVHAIACRALGIRHLRTRPYRPQTNGKAERFIRTMLGGWAYGAIYRTSAERHTALEGWLWRYNFRRPHGSLGRRPPAARLAELRNNPLGSYN
jgi:transposase InsO family protein